MRPEIEQREAIKSIRDYYSPLIQHAETASREYSLLAVRSIITLNAGVAVAYPAIVELFLENISLGELVSPVLIAVVGAVFGVICSYTTYFNHNFEAYDLFSEMELEVVKADEHFDTSTYYTFRKSREVSKEEWVRRSANSRKWQNRTFYVANISGVLGAICFVVSVIWFAISVAS